MELLKIEGVFEAINQRDKEKQRRTDVKLRCPPCRHLSPFSNPPDHLSNCSFNRANVAVWTLRDATCLPSNASRSCNWLIARRRMQAYLNRRLFLFWSRSGSWADRWWASEERGNEDVERKTTAEGVVFECQGSATKRIVFKLELIIDKLFLSLSLSAFTGCQITYAEQFCLY